MGPVDTRALRGTTVVDAAGNKVGEIEDVYLDRATNRPEWALVHTGLFGAKKTFVPLAGATSTDGGALQLPFDGSRVKDAPRVDDGGGELSETDERALYRHYGIPYSDARSETTMADPRADAPTWRDDDGGRRDEDVPGRVDDTARGPRSDEVDRGQGQPQAQGEGRPQAHGEGQPQAQGEGRPQAQGEGGDASLIDGADEYAQRWEAVQTAFVDEPRRAVERADALVEEVIGAITATFKAERERLEAQWSSGGDASTEDMRLALQRYRSFFHRLLSATPGR